MVGSTIPDKRDFAEGNAALTAEMPEVTVRRSNDELKAISIGVEQRGGGNGHAAHDLTILSGWRGPGPKPSFSGPSKFNLIPNDQNAYARALLRR
ncbi:hypothetical protein [Pseudogemmobacter sonorensis]|uniref:hypothetical protein n=1 Tax=Pseudogemmobacter sonorensis TaxID=2989681 RepID=UPI0036A15AB8